MVKSEDKIEVGGAGGFEPRPIHEAHASSNHRTYYTTEKSRKLFNARPETTLGQADNRSRRWRSGKLSLPPDRCCTSHGQADHPCR